MKKASLRDVQAKLGEYVKTSATHPVVILDGKEPVALLVGIRGRKRHAPLKLRDVLKRAWKEYEQQGGIPHDQFWDDLAKDAG